MRGAGGQVERGAFGDERDEARVGRGAESPTRSPPALPPSEMLVLARTGYATRADPARARAAGIPHRVLGSLGLYERAEVRDALAYLTLLANPADAQAFRRAVQAPRRGIGTASANRLVIARPRAHRQRPDRRQRARPRAERDPLGRRSRPARAVRRRARAHPARPRAGRSLGHVVVAP